MSEPYWLLGDDDPAGVSEVMGIKGERLPGPSPSEDEGDGVAGENAGQAGEVGVAVRLLLEHPLVHLYLEGGGASSGEEEQMGETEKEVEGEEGVYQKEIRNK